MGEKLHSGVDKGPINKNLVPLSPQKGRFELGGKRVVCHTEAPGRTKGSHSAKLKGKAKGFIPKDSWS